jgi:hypothetical protein
MKSVNRNIYFDISSWKQVKDRVQHWVWGITFPRIWWQLEDQIEEEISNQIKDKLWHNFYYKR